MLQEETVRNCSNFRLIDKKVIEIGSQKLCEVIRIFAFDQQREISSEYL